MDEEIIPALRAEDAARAVGRYARLGFAQQWEHRFEPGFPVLTEVAHELELTDPDGNRVRVGEAGG
ncbi:hypothetical protein QIS99_15360 [Streptomyces sp. B-S-A8]|uniref:Glyoxalase-like domain-containing protein n=1 Tax=Streptomyces solicavernae TaxID=3043614 RepID=A0ABT6RT04_9ACTN|nr:hypothetical protein [Streptomyces sp. B-S-A8]MDI3387567.1 hypothetical protein [Streptomyces sp. B-S-A8]